MKNQQEAPKLEIKPQSFSELVETSLADLALIDQESHPKSATALGLYSLGMKFYMLGRPSELESLLSEIRQELPNRSSDLEFLAVSLLLELRLKIRNRSLNKEEFDQIVAKIPTQLNSALLAEISFVSAQALELFSEHKLAYEVFKEASVRYDDASCFKKACRAKLNSLANFSCLKTDADMIPEYLTLADRAEACGEMTSVGVAKINVSREYQRLGSHSVALKYCDEALSALHSEKGTLHKGLGILQKAHIMYDLKKSVEALRLIQEAKVYPFPEVKEAAVVLEKKITNKSLNVVLKNLIPTWKERFKDFFMSPQSVSSVNLEQKVIALLSQHPRDKFDLIEELYGTQESFFLLENRLKNLLNRIRRKYPGQLVFLDNKYHFKSQFEVGASS